MAFIGRLIAPLTGTPPIELMLVGWLTGAIVIGWPSPLARCTGARLPPSTWRHSPRTSVFSSVLFFTRQKDEIADGAGCFAKRGF